MTFFIAIISTAILTPYSIRFAFKVGAIDIPKDERRAHSKPMPRIGGLAIIFGFLISTVLIFLFSEIDRTVNLKEVNLIGFYLGIFIISIIGFFDDINISKKGLKPTTKLLGQILAAVCVVMSGARIFYIDLPFLNSLYGLNDFLSIIITIGWVVGVTNAINLIDGLDGLATGVSAIAVLSLLVIFILNGTAAIPLILISGLLGALLGFLPYNFNPAKTFMGDTGSNFLGFSIATISILGMAKTYTIMAIALPFVVLALPIFDTLFAIFRRIKNGKSIMEADRGHLHHRLVDLGLTQRQAVIVLYCIAAIFGIFAIVLMKSSIWKVIGFIFIVCILCSLEVRNIKVTQRKGLPTKKVTNFKDGDKLRVMLVFGTRPEAIKMCPLVMELKKRPDIVTIVVVTAQHREMLDQVLNAFSIKPDYDLNIMKSKQTLTHITSAVLTGVYDIIQVERPDIVLVHGDTTTTMAAAEAAFDSQVLVGHVEAGLRTYDKYSPFPEEMNRKIVTQIADLFFAPTENNKNNLLKEMIKEDDIFITGNTVIDALKTTVVDDYKFTHPVLEKLDFKNKKIIFMTAHRRENLGEPLYNICEAVKQIALENDDVEIVYPVHLNPVVQETAHSVLDGIENVHLIEPLDVIITHNLINKSTLVLTDSGGIQEEAPSLGKPVLVLRTETERPEAVKAGTVKVVGTNKETIVKETTKLLKNKEEYDKMSKASNPYGDGNACDRIVEAIRYHFGITKKRVKDLK